MAGRAAVVIGINYETQIEGSGSRAGLTRLRYAEADARDVAAELTVAGYDVRLLLGAEATERAIRRALTAQRRVAGIDGLLVVHFSGHGDVDPEDEQTAYLLPVDTDPGDLGATAIPLRTLVHDYLGRVGTALTLLDCCHSGWALGWKSAENRGAPFLRQARATFTAAAQGRVVVTACPGEELAREAADLEHGVFSHFLLDHWRTYPDSVTVESLFLRLAEGLRTRSLPLPVRGGTSEGPIVLRPARPAASILPPPPVGLSAAEVERREQLHATLRGLSEAGWAALLTELGEEAAQFGGARTAAARRLILKLAAEGMLGALAAEAGWQAAEQAAVAAQVNALIQQFEAARKRRAWEAASKLGEQILELDAQQPDTRVQVATIYWELGRKFHAESDYERAIINKTRAIELDPQQDLHYYARGVSYEAQGDYDRAIADYAQAIELDPQNAEYYWQRGVIYQVKGDYDHAITDETRAIELNPQDAVYYWHRGVSYHAKGDYDLALADYSRAIALDPQQADYYRQRGVSYHNKGDYDRALADYTQAIALDPQNGEYHYLRGLAYKHKGEQGVARGHFERALALGYEAARAELA